MNNYILKYDGYILNDANEEGYPLFLSKNLLGILLGISTDPIAKSILDESAKNLFNGNKYEVSYLDIDRKDSKLVSFLPKNRIDKLGIDTTKIQGIDSIVWTSNMRQNMNWGKMINTLFPGKFTNMEIDRFYNRYRPQIDISEKEISRFKLVRGEEIRKWYLHTNWDGELKSCMQDEKQQPFFNIYCDNVEKCGLLIYFSEKRDDKIIGRALVWNNLLKPSGETAENKNPYTLLDRVYHLIDNNQIEPVFQKYAIDHGWIYKHNNESYMMNGLVKTVSVSTRLIPKEYKYYPYMDTMKYYTPTTGRAASAAGNPARDPNNPGRTFPRYFLQETDGGKKLN